MKYAFHNSGNVYQFNPGKPVYDIRDGVKRNALDFHTELVRERDTLDCFITDDKGNIIVKSKKPTTHKKADWRKFVKKIK